MASSNPSPCPSPNSNIQSSQRARSVKRLDVVEAYDQWADTYDTDNNFLQAMDTYHLTHTLLPSFLDALPPVRTQSQQTHIVDLGAGTGRASLLLLSALQERRDAGNGHVRARFTALDASPKMLKVAERKVREAGFVEEFETRVFDIAASSGEQEGVAPLTGADAVLSTLVLEHVTLEAFFAAASTLLKTTGGLLLVTGMHSDMGAVSQAGFVDEKSGEKVLAGRSWVHTVEEVVDEARRAGFGVLGEVLKRGVGIGSYDVEEDVARFGPRARKWDGCLTWFGMIFQKERDV